MILVASAIVFLVVIIFTKNGWTILKRSQNSSGLAYDGVLVGDLVKQDTNNNKIPDWEEKLLSPEQIQKDLNTSSTLNDEKLTQTEKFSRELFATVAALNQTGPIDQNTADQLSASLLEKIQNPEIKRLYLITEIKTTKDNSLDSLKKYINDLASVYKKYPKEGETTAVFQEFLNDGKEVNVSALEKLDPIIKKIQETINGQLKINTPSDFAQPHLNVINALEVIMENLNDIKLFDTDPIITMGAISKYGENLNTLQSEMNSLINTLSSKLKN